MFPHRLLLMVVLGVLQVVGGLHVTRVPFKRPLTKLWMSPTETEKTNNAFVPVFVSVWAVGYTGVAAQQVLGYRFGDGTVDVQALGESGGILGVGLTVVLFVALIGASAYEVFKDGP